MKTARFDLVTLTFLSLTPPQRIGSQAAQFAKAFLLLAAALFQAPAALAAAPAAASSVPGEIPWADLGATATAQYSGDGLSVTLTEHAARLRCVFQGLEAEVTSEGLWLTSMVANAVNDHFRI